MKDSTHTKFKPSLVLSALVGGMLFTSCGGSGGGENKNAAMSDSAAPQASAQVAALPASAPEAYQAQKQAGKVSADNNAISGQPREAPAAKKAQAYQYHTQLVKKANITLLVNSIEDTIQDTSKIVKQQHGDLLNFEDQKPPNEYTRHTASMQVQVPQENLDSTLDAFNQLGTVQHRTLTAENVTNQLVDNEARLRNLRKQETTLQKIMERSGSIPDVLRVAQELSNVRQSIEEIDGQVKSLRNQVAYSTISLELEAPAATTSTHQRSEQPLGLLLQETWNQSTHSVGEFTLGLIRSCISVAVWAPYILILGGALWFGYTKYRQKPSPEPEEVSDTPNPG